MYMAEKPTVAPSRNGDAESIDAKQRNRNVIDGRSFFKRAKSVLSYDEAGYPVLQLNNALYRSLRTCCGM
jgi:hypothetical protein